ncbi:MAG: membrane dipeptidase [Burkholderiales bacterium]|nr:membrane dipeptidase [Burkholderiales bacterium]
MTMPTPPGIGRRTLLGAALPALALGPFAARAQAPVPIADMHSHYGLINRTLRDSGLAEDLRAQRVALVAWSLPSDLRWIRATPSGIEQFREPEPGSLSSFFLQTMSRMRAYLAENGLKTVLTGADVDACIAGDAGVVLASEGTDFLEGRLDNLDKFRDLGLRHVQLVHYIRNPVGDFQTAPPSHGGLSELGKQLVQACNAKGMLVDLAHSPGPSLDQALAISKVPMVFSHGWVDRSEGSWSGAAGYLRRRLSLEQAKKIAAGGGVVGLWGFALGSPGPSRTPGRGNWTVSRGDTRGYARELANLIGWLGADHVAIGTDIEGVGSSWSVNDYSHVRKVVEALQDMKLPGSVVEKVAFANYARVLKTALAAGR